LALVNSSHGLGHKRLSNELNFAYKAWAFRTAAESQVSLSLHDPPVLTFFPFPYTQPSIMRAFLFASIALAAAGTLSDQARRAEWP